MKKEQYSLLAQPPKIFQIIKIGFSIWKHTFNKTIAFSLINSAIMYLDIFFQYEKISPIYGHLFSIVSQIIGFMMLISIVYSINKSVHNENISFNQAIKISCKKILPLILLGILSLIVIIVGMILLVIPGIFCMISLAFSNFFVIVEENSVVNSMKKSFRLVSGNWWYTFGAILIISLISCIIVVSLMGLCFIVPTFFAFVKNYYEMQVDYHTTQIVFIMSLLGISMPLTMIFIYPWGIASMLAIFYSLKAKNSVANVTK